MNLKSLAVASALVAASLSSQATTTNWAAHDQLEVGFATAVNTSVFDTFSFTLGQQSWVESSTIAFGDLIGGSYSLYSAGTNGTIGGGDDVGLGAWTTNGAKHGLTLAAGTYFYSVLGGASGSASYVLSSSAVAAPVPEPETYAMLAAGLGIVGFVASRRRRND